jgi:hypothetical protein
MNAVVARMPSETPLGFLALLAFATAIGSMGASRVAAQPSQADGAKVVGAQGEHELTPGERQAVKEILDRIAALAGFLEKSPVPTDPDLGVLYSYLAHLKEIQGNSNNDVSLVACLMAKEYLNRQLEMKPFNAVSKAQGAAGLDIDERTKAGARVVAEIKTTMPYGPKDLGAAQQSSFEKDFKKLDAAAAAHRFFFVTEPRTFELMRVKYAAKIPGVTVVLLPSGESFVAPAKP